MAASLPQAEMRRRIFVRSVSLPLWHYTKSSLSLGRSHVRHFKTKRTHVSDLMRTLRIWMCPNIFIFFAPQLCRPTTAMSAERCDRTPLLPSIQKPAVRTQFCLHIYGFPALLTADYRVVLCHLSPYLSIGCFVYAPIVPLVIQPSILFSPPPSFTPPPLLLPVHIHTLLAIGSSSPLTPA